MVAGGGFTGRMTTPVLPAVAFAEKLPVLEVRLPKSNTNISAVSVDDRLPNAAVSFAWQ